MSVVGDGVAEIQAFVEGLHLVSPLNSQRNEKSFSEAYRYVHALLIWAEAITRGGGSQPSEAAILQFRELLSDLAAAEFLTLGGFYKPARMMLRSSIENCLRVIAHEQGFLAGGAKFTFELITLVRSSNAGAVGSPVQSDIEAVISAYGRLCAYTHASTPRHLALRIPLASAAAFDQIEYNQIVSDIKSLGKRYNRIMFFIYHSRLDGLDHRKRDFVLDALPKSLKRFVFV